MEKHPKIKHTLHGQGACRTAGVGDVSHWTTSDSTYTTQGRGCVAERRFGGRSRIIYRVGMMNDGMGCIGVAIEL